MPSAGGDEGSPAGIGAESADASGSGAASGGGEAFRPSTFSFLRSVASRSEEEERRASEADGGEGGLDPAAAEATRRAFEGAVLAQWERLRAARVA